MTNFRDIRYNNTVTYGELFLQNEYEMSRYNLDEADVAEQRTRFELYEKEVGWILALQGQAEVAGEGGAPASAGGAERGSAFK